MKAQLEIKRNKSITYLLPIFSRFVPVSYFRLLVNTYLWFDDYTEEVFCLLYKFDGKIKGKMSSREGFTVYEEKVLRRNKYYLGSDDYDKHVIFKFTLPEEMFDLRTIFLEGKYSKLPLQAQTIVLEWTMRYYGPNDRAFIEMIFNKDPELRERLLDKLGSSTKLPHDAEVSSAPYEDEEMFANSVEFVKENIETRDIFK